MIKELLMSNKIKTIGRTYLNNDMLYANFSGSGVWFKASGNKLKIDLLATKYDEENSRPYVSVLIDNARYDFPLDKELNTIELPLEYGEHFIHILKRTETSVSHMAIKDILVDNFIIFEDEPRLNIEYYGDSLTCGFGAMSTDPSEPFRTSTESFLDSYSYMVAKALNANYSAISISGFPVYKSRWNQSFPIDSVADMISISSYKEDDTIETVIPWDNTIYKPDLVIINLGTNDQSFLTEGQDWVDKLIEETKSFEAAQTHPQYEEHLVNFRQRIVKFLEDLFKTYGKDLKVLYLMGMIDVWPFVYDAIEGAIADFNNPNVYYHRLTGPTKDSIFGAVWHPSKVMHEKTAEEILEVIKQNNLGK